MPEQIEVTVAPDGETKVEVKGCPGIILGKQCADLTKALESALGSVTSDVKKPEFYQPQTATQKATQ